MKFISAIGAGVLALAATAQAQVQVQCSQSRNLYLQYEPINLTVAVINVTDAPISLSTDEHGKSWLSFLVFTRDTGSLVSQIKSVEVPPLKIEPGDATELTVNILPCYGIRSTGGYSAQAVINIPGRQGTMTGKLYFTVGKGETMWKKEVYNTGVKRVYSLVRFLDINEANLYLRVEEPDMNLMYNTVRLGKIVAFADPKVEFDREGNIHILQVINAHTYRYTQADAEGNLIAPQQDRLAQPNFPMPALVKSADGGIALVGGLNPKEAAERATLSDTQTP